MPRKVGTLDLVRFVRVHAVLLTGVHAHPLLQLSMIDRPLAGWRRCSAWLGATGASCGACRRPAWLGATDARCGAWSIARRLGRRVRCLGSYSWCRAVLWSNAWRGRCRRRSAGLGPTDASRGSLSIARLPGRRVRCSRGCLWCVAVWSSARRGRSGILLLFVVRRKSVCAQRKGDSYEDEKRGFCVHVSSVIRQVVILAGLDRRSLAAWGRVYVRFM
jgi:hypothetical protein